MLNLLSSRISFPGNFRRSGLPSFHCSARICANDALNACSSSKENSTMIVQSDAPDSSSLYSLPADAVADDTVQSSSAVVCKPKKNKLKGKKHADVLEEMADSQVVVSDNAELSGKKSKRGSQVTRSEDVEGHCGNFPVDDLVEFIYTGRKLNKAKSKPSDDDEFSAIDQKSVAIKMRSSSSSVYSAMESDSGFGDVESSDRGDSVISDDSISPALLLSTESCEAMQVVVVDTEENPAQADDINIECPVQDSRATGSSNDNSTKCSEAAFACFENDETTIESDFVVVRQKKRRDKPAKLLVAEDSENFEQKSRPSRLQNGTPRSAIAVRDKFNRRFLMTKNNSRLSSPDTLSAGRGVQTTFTQQVFTGGSCSLKNSSNKPPNSVCNFDEARSCSVAQRNENLVTNSDVGTMTISDAVSEVEHPTLSDATRLRLSVDNTNRRLNSRKCPVEKVDVSLGHNSTETSNSCPSTPTVSRTQSPCSSCDISESGGFNVDAAQSFLFKAFQNAVQMAKTHPHSVQFYRPDMVSVDVAV